MRRCQSARIELFDIVRIACKLNCQSIRIDGVQRRTVPVLESPRGDMGGLAAVLDLLLHIPRSLERNVRC